jgi:dCMP deaminase
MTCSSKVIISLKKCADRSKKFGTKVGAILIDKNENIFFEASNDYIYPLYDDPNIENENNRSFYSEHAERRLIFLAVSSGFSDFQDKILVVTHFPCCDCARAIVLVGIKKVMIFSYHVSNKFLSKWEADMAISKRILEYNNVEVVHIKSDYE